MQKKKTPTKKKGKILDFEALKQASETVKTETLEEVKKKFYVCQNCGGLRFNQTFILKHVTPLDDSELKENAIVPTLMFECSNCKKLANIYE